MTIIDNTYKLGKSTYPLVIEYYNKLIDEWCDGKLIKVYESNQNMLNEKDFIQALKFKVELELWIRYPRHMKNIENIGDENIKRLVDNIFKTREKEMVISYHSQMIEIVKKYY